MDFDTVFIVTHVAFRKDTSVLIEGPYSSVANAFAKFRTKVKVLLLPLNGFADPIFYGKWQTEKKYQFPRVLGKISPFKYILDMLIAIYFLYRCNSEHKNKKKLVIGIDPLSCLPLLFFKKLLGFKLVYYCVDFNKNRFGPRFMQYLYEKADELSSKLSDQTWVVCESLQEYKKDHFKVDSIYIPNSSIFDGNFYKTGKNKRTGNKMAWTGSCITDRQFEILFKVISGLQKIHRDLGFYFAPTGNHDQFEEYAKKYKLKKYQVLHLHSRSAWQNFAATCDVGIAVYDDKFGSTKFIEPLKIWDFMMCGLPFVISSEPSVATPVKKSGVAYFLKAHNTILADNSLENFLAKRNLIRLEKKCIDLAREFDISKQIEKAINIF